MPKSETSGLNTNEAHFINMSKMKGADLVALKEAKDKDSGKPSGKTVDAYDINCFFLLKNNTQSLNTLHARD